MPTENDTTQTQTSGTSGAGGTQSTTGANGAGSSGAASRPDWLPEPYWDGTKNAPKADDLTKHLSEYPDLRAFKAGIDSQRAAVPEDPAKYDLKLPSDWKPPEGLEKFDLDPEDPRWGVVRQIAKEAGVDQAGFEKIAGLAAAFEAQQHVDVQAAIKRQMDALGPKATERVDALKTFIAAKAGPQAADVFAPVLMLKDGVIALEALVKAATTGGAPNYSAAGREGGEDANEKFAALPPAERVGRRGFANARALMSANGR